jgi:hypothetical protein
MKCSEWGLAAWCLGSWWCVLWIRNKLPLSNMPSSTRYNGSTDFGRYSPLGGAGEGVQEGRLICRLGYCQVAQSIGLVNTGSDQVAEPKEVEHSTQRTSTDTLGASMHLQQRRVFKHISSSSYLCEWAVAAGVVAVGIATAGEEVIMRGGRCATRKHAVFLWE